MTVFLTWKTLRHWLRSGGRLRLQTTRADNPPATALTICLRLPSAQPAGPATGGKETLHLDVVRPTPEPSAKEKELEALFTTARTELNREVRENRKLSARLAEYEQAKSPLRNGSISH